MTHAEMLKACEEQCFAINSVIHLGSMLGDGEIRVEPVEEMISSFHGLKNDELFKDLPWLKGVLRAHRKDLKDSGVHHQEAQSMLWAAIYDHAKAYNTLGFLVEVKQPVLEPCPGGFTTRGSLSKGQYFYAETYEQAFAKALAWAKANVDEAEAQGQKLRTA